jgi:hypothetical protein
LGEPVTTTTGGNHILIATAIDQLDMTLKFRLIDRQACLGKCQIRFELRLKDI